VCIVCLSAELAAPDAVIRVNAKCVFFFCIDTSVQEVFYPYSSLYYGVQKIKGLLLFQLNSGCQQQQ
jgi:hypothetical protein